MKIRSITYFCNPGWPLEGSRLEQAGKFLAEARAAYESAGYEVQSTRLATVPFPRLLGRVKMVETPRLAEQLETAIQAVGIPHAALGPASEDILESFSAIPEAIAATQNVFFSGVMADVRSGISIPALL